VEQALANAAEWPGPIVVHVLTQKGRGYAPAEEDDVQRLHDVKVQAPPAADGPTGLPGPGPVVRPPAAVARCR
jgi:deoxyxylulose-5-phosphate synthase